MGTPGADLSAAAFQTPGSKSDAGASEHLSGRKSSQTALTPQKTRTAEKCSKATARERKKNREASRRKREFLKQGQRPGSREMKCGSD